jgi:hypothetical protein
MFLNKLSEIESKMGRIEKELKNKNLLHMTSSGIEK